MKIPEMILSAAVAVLVGAVSAQAQPKNLDVSTDVQEKLRNSYIFVFNDSVRPGDAKARAQALADESGAKLGHVYSTAIRGFSAKLPEAAARRLAENNPAIAYYEPDAPVRVSSHGPWWCFFFPTHPDCVHDSGPAPEVTPYGITRVGGPQDGTGLTAWIIDTGIDQDHPDLNVDTGRSADFTGIGSANDGHGHGTHVAGTVAAIDNDIDVVGVAAGATVVAVRVLDSSGSGTLSDVIAGVDYVAANASPGEVANMSLGGSANQSLDDAVSNAASQGIRFAIAAGNDGFHANNKSPARVEHPNVWTVSAIDSNDNFASFSNFGNPPIECAAPGVSVQSLDNDGGGLVTMSGTSMAAPHVAGILLFGTPGSDGTAIGDPDGDPDPICHF